jgi:hypothetical protein
VTQTYVTRGFRITSMMVDGQFEPLRGELAGLGIAVNCVFRDKHVPEIERHIRTVKERTRCIYNQLPFTKMPARITIEMVYASTFWLNIFPPTDGVSKTMSPRAIIVGGELDYGKHCRLEFGTYCQVHEEHDNTMATRTTGAIALRPRGNTQGGYYFFSLATGHRLNRNRWTELPMPADVIDRVYTLARRGLAVEGLSFADRNGHDPNDGDPNRNDDDDDDASWNPGDDDDDTDDEADDGDASLQDDNTAGVNDDDVAHENENDLFENNFAENETDKIAENETDENTAPEIESTRNDTPNGNPNVNPNDNPNIENTAPEIEDTRNDTPNVNPNVNPNDNPNINPETENTVHNDASETEEDERTENNGTDHGDNQQALDEQMKQQYGERHAQHDLRPRRPRDYGHLHAMLEHTAMTQYTVNKGLKVLSEMKQLHDRKAVKPKSGNQITCKERHDSLRYLMFLKEKRCGKIKGRGCADGRKQRDFLTKEETSSPTVAIGSVMLSCTIDAHEHRDVATTDIPGAFLQTDMEGNVHMVLEGKMAELLARLDPKLYRKHIMIKKGKPIMHVQLKKALYGTLHASLLFWKDLSKNLTDRGFVINPYDWCVANKTINRKQCTVLWHVDDIKVSHEDPDVVMQVLSMFEGVYGSKDAPLTITRGKIHDYLGMKIDFEVKGKVAITMVESIQAMLDVIPDDMGGGGWLHPPPPITYLT